MGNTLTQERIKELLEEIQAYELMLKEYADRPESVPAWATLAIAKAKLTSLTNRKNK